MRRKNIIVLLLSGLFLLGFNAVAAEQQASFTPWNDSLGVSGGGGEFGEGGEGGGMTIEDAIAIMKAKLNGEFINSEEFANALLAYLALGDPGASAQVLNSNPQAFFESMVNYVQTKFGNNAQVKYYTNLSQDSRTVLKDTEVKDLKQVLSTKQKEALAVAAKKVAETITGKKAAEGEDLTKKGEQATENAKQQLTDKIGEKQEGKEAYKITSAAKGAELLAQWNEQGLGDLGNPKNLAAYVAAHGERYNTETQKIEYQGKDGKWYVDTAIENERAGMQGTLDDRDACLDPHSIGTGGGTGGGGGGGGGNRTVKDEELAPVKPVVTNTTDATQSCADPVLSVTTNRAAACQYNKSGGFSYGSGTSFRYTGNFTHNTGLSGLTNGQKTYYVICKDDATGGVSDALKIEFKVDLSLDPENAPKVTNATPEKQTNKTPVLAVTTDRKAECRYKNASFTFASGAVIATANKYSHSISIASLDDGELSFYVMCKDIETEAISEEKIINTTLDRITGSEPVITNTTSAYQTVANPWLSLTTTRNATCQYKESSFAFGAGTNFTTTGSTSHKVQLNNISDGQYTYYASCKDTATQVANATSTQMIFTVAATAPVVSNITPARQVNNPVVAVTTDRPAACQYKDSNFTYGVGTAIATSDNYSHSASISTLSDGSHTLYVICRDASTQALSAAKEIATVLDRTGATGAPVITNTTNGYQTTDSPALTIATDVAAVCQYKTSSFTYNNGIQFTADGGMSHSVSLNNLSDGQHIYYVVCKGNASGIANSEGNQVVFTVDTAGSGGNCASLTANDRKNDGNRSYDENIDDNSVYPWQAAEGGTRDRFAKVDWFAGYQFTPNKKGRVTQLCGYFDSGKTNKVVLVNGSYAELATAQVTGNGSWKCVDISPVAIEADKRYYVVARIKDNPVYFEYKSGLLPKNSGNVLIEAGVRQTIISENFKSDIVKYDYMIFGLVDVKITYSQTTATGPVIDSVSPVGTVTSSSAKISAQSSQSAACRFGREDVSYSSMDYSLPKESGSTFSQKVCNLEDGNYTFYIRCKSSSGVENSVSTPVQFKIAQ